MVRTYKIADTVLCLGVYKKKGTVLAASFTTSAGIELDKDSTILAKKILAKIFRTLTARLSELVATTCRAWTVLLRQASTTISQQP